MDVKGINLTSFTVYDMIDVQVIGMRGQTPFNDIINHFVSLGGEIALMDPMFIYGKNHVISAVKHAERSFKRGSNRSKTIMTETLLYVTGERQIYNAMKRIKPKGNEYVAAVINVAGDMDLEKIGMKRDDSLIDGNDKKKKTIGLEEKLGIPYEDLVLEMVAMLDLAKC